MPCYHRMVVSQVIILTCCLFLLVMQPNETLVECFRRWGIPEEFKQVKYSLYLKKDAPLSKKQKRQLKQQRKQQGQKGGV